MPSLPILTTTIERWKEFILSKDDEEIITPKKDSIYNDKVFKRTLVKKLWTDSPYNVGAFKHTMTQAWRLKNHVDIHDLNENLLF